MNTTEWGRYRIDMLLYGIDTARARGWVDEYYPSIQPARQGRDSSRGRGSLGRCYRSGDRRRQPETIGPPAQGARARAGARARTRAGPPGRAQTGKTDSALLNPLVAVSSRPRPRKSAQNRPGRAKGEKPGIILSPARLPLLRHSCPIRSPSSV